MGCENVKLYFRGPLVGAGEDRVSRMDRIDEARKGIGRQKSIAFALLAAAVFTAIALDRFGASLSDRLTNLLPLVPAVPGLIFWILSRRAQARLRETESED